MSRTAVLAAHPEDVEPARNARRPTPSLAAAAYFSFVSPVSDRLKELQRQRALAQEQLAWLDREIAREAGQSVPPPPAPVAPATPQPVPVARDAISAAHAAADAEAILAQYRSEPEKLQKSVKLGCYLYFFLALGMLILGMAGWYFLRTPH